MAFDFTPPGSNTETGAGKNRQTNAKILNSAVVNPADIIAVRTGRDATAASRGKADNVGDGTIEEVFVGQTWQGTRTGTSDNNGPRILAERNAGDFGGTFAVTGLAGDATDLWKAVYCRNNTLYIDSSRPARAHPVGYIYEYIDSSYANVAFFDGPMLAQFAVTRQTVDLGTIVLAGTDTTKTLLKWPVPYHCRIVSVEAYYAVAAAGASATSTLTFQRDPLSAGSGQVAVTGGSITLATGAGNTEGDVVAGSAVTANNILHEGDRLDGVLAITADGTFSGGNVVVRATVDRLLGT